MTPATRSDDSVGISQNGTLIGNATTTTDGTRGEVLTLDGTGDGVDITGVFGSPVNGTFAAWVNLTAAGSQGAEVISIGDAFVLRLDENGNGVSGVYYNGSAWVSIASGQFIAGTGWHHVAFSFDDTNNIQTLYLDGEVVATTNSTDSISHDIFSKTTIGHHANGSSIYDFNGLIDDARIYTRALSADEIASLAADNTSATGNVAITVNPVAVNDEPTFGVGVGDGIVTTGIGAGFDAGYSVAMQADGKILVAGYSHDGSEL